MLALHEMPNSDHLPYNGKYIHGRRFTCDFGLNGESNAKPYNSYFVIIIVIVEYLCVET